MAEIPEGLRPAQLGVVLVGRPVIGHAAATLVSLARRGLVTANETEDGSWGIGLASGTGDPARFDGTRFDGVWFDGTRFEGTGFGGTRFCGARFGGARFEGALLGGLPAGPVPLSALPDSLAPALRAFADDLIKDAVRHGWLKRTRHDRRTSRGEELAARTRSLRAGLRRARATGDEETVDGLLEYALVFGLLAGSEAPLARFGAAFTAACADLPGWRQPERRHAEFGDPDFTRDEWRGMGLGGAAILSSNLGGPF